MSDEELRRCISETFDLIKRAAPSSHSKCSLETHLDSLLKEQRRRAEREQKEIV